MERLKWWFFRVAALQFLLTAATGLVLYLRPLDDRAGAYSKQTKEWLVMLHNGEWLSYLALHDRRVSGFLVGGALAVLVVRLAARSLARRSPSPPGERAGRGVS